MFTEGELSCEDQSPPGRPATDLAAAGEHFIAMFPFSSAKRIASHFRVTYPTAKEMMHRNLGMRRFKRKSQPHLLTEAPDEVTSNSPEPG